MAHTPIDLHTLAHEIADFGPRTCGGGAITAARRRLIVAWEAAGVPLVRLQSVSTHAWTRRAPTVHQLAGTDTGADQLIPALAAYPSQMGRCEGPVVDLRNGDEPRPGAIAILPHDHVQTPVMADWVAAGLAGALIPSREHPDVPQLWYLYRHAPFPVAGIPADIADQLAASPGARVRIANDGELRDVDCANLVATLGPSDTDYIVLGAHLDTHPISPGVFDNLSGVLGISGVLSRLLERGTADWRRGLRVIAYTGEEVGWAGSLTYVNSIRQSLSRCRLCVNFDSLGHCTARGIAVIGAPHWLSTVQTLAPAAEIRDHFCWGSDYLPFVCRGVPSLRPADFWGELPPWTHFEFDDISRLDLPAIQANVDTWTPILDQLLRAESLPEPTQLREPAQVRADIEAAGQAENLAWRLPVTPRGAAAARRLGLPVDRFDR